MVSVSELKANLSRFDCVDGFGFEPGDAALLRREGAGGTERDGHPARAKGEQAMRTGRWFGESRQLLRLYLVRNRAVDKRSQVFRGRSESAPGSAPSSCPGAVPPSSRHA